ncbi:hypothetical protein [Mesorhizobium sp. IMUNJ 23232]|uniref:hypothetical protein n=1 Tax=Mesorhizobium sp. IMUNJ 23232 TaxID=3376064 RepID=UPI0037A5859B
MLRKRYWVAVSFVLAAVLTLAWHRNGGPVDLEEAIVRAAVVDTLTSADSRCPLSDRAIGTAASWLLAACTQGGLAWYDAAHQYGDDAAKVFTTFGNEPTFKEVFQTLGPPVVPVITYFVRNGSTQYLLQETIGQGVSHLWNGEAIGFGVAELTPEQYGLIAIEELRTRGHEMLSEFEIVNGTAVRKQFTRTVLGAKSLFLGGISDVETVIARGERLPKWSEVGWAAVDATMIAGGIGVAVKSLRAVKVPATIVGRNTARLATLRSAGGGAVRSLSALAKASGIAAVVAVPYVAITRPQLVATAAGWVAEQIGMPAWLGVFLVFSTISLIFLLAVRLILAPILFVARRLNHFRPRTA